MTFNEPTVRVDGDRPRSITFNTEAYAHVDHGYAATIHKSQGVTVDRAFLLAGRNLDRHSAYVAMTRHRDRLDLHWSAQAIGTRARLERIIGREALKDTSLDYGAAHTRQARQDAADDLRQRIDTRTARFRERERTPAGRLANARSLAGRDARPADVARLTLDRAGRLRLYRQQQAILRARAAQAQARAMQPPVTGQGTDKDRQAALIAFDAETARLETAMRERFAAERQDERQARLKLTALAIRAWRKARLLAVSAVMASLTDPVTEPESIRPPIEQRFKPSGPTLH